MRKALPWWWWTATALTGLLLVAVVASFVWVFAWTPCSGTYYLYLEHGLICGNQSVLPPGWSALPSYGHFEAYRSGVYTAWRLLPDLDFSGPGPVAFQFPVHLFLVVLLPMVIVPLLKRYLRRESDLCRECGYNLTGNTSGRCPECGEAV